MAAATESPSDALTGAGAGHAAGVPSRPWLLAVLQWAAVAGLCWLCTLPLARVALDGIDQALFRLGADALTRGAQLYTDFWDVKQPGIYWFYALAGRLFSADPTQGLLVDEVRTLNMLWLVASGMVATRIVRMVQPTRWIWVLTPVVTLLPFCLRLDWTSTGQVESLVMLPMMLIIVLGLTARTVRSDAMAMLLVAAAGLLACVVAVFKLALAPIALALLAIGIGARVRERYRDLPARSRAFTAALALAGVIFAAGLAAASLPFLSGRDPQLFFWTQFLYPFQAISMLQGPPLSKLFWAVLQVLSGVVFLLPAALLGAVVVFRSPDSGRHQLGWACLAWMVLTVLAVIAQRLSWHGYHFVTLIWPIGILATVGLAQLRDVRLPRAARGAVLAVLLLGLLIAASRPLLRGPAPASFLPESSGYLRQLPDVSRQIRQDSCRTGIAFSSPAFLLAAGLEAATSISGQLGWILLPTQWEALFRELRQRKPRFAYLDQGQFTAALGVRAPLLLDWLHHEYEPIGTDSFGGRWYRHIGQGGECMSTVLYARMAAARRP